METDDTLSGNINFKEIQDNNPPSTKLFSRRRRSEKDKRISTIKHIHHLLIAEAILLVLGGMLFGFAIKNEYTKDYPRESRSGYGVAKR